MDFLTGAILVFLPGYDDLISVAEKIKCIQNGFKRKPFIYLLHSQIGNQDQLKVFQPAAYQYRKVVSNRFKRFFNNNQKMKLMPEVNIFYEDISINFHSNEYFFRF